MKLKLTTGKYRNRKCFRFRAVIPKSIEQGIPRRYQKTWHVVIEDPMFKEMEIKPMFVAEARRWRAKIMAKLFGEATPPLPHQEEFET